MSGRTTLPIPKVERTCDRCNVEMTRQPLYEGSEDECWYCPCCRSRLRTVEMLQAGWERRANALGMTMDEYEAHMEIEVAQFVRKPTESELEHARSLAVRMSEEWEPVCPHVTNPWKADA